jgi:hypothetical protein
MVVGIVFVRHDGEVYVVGNAERIAQGRDQFLILPMRSRSTPLDEQHLQIHGARGTKSRRVSVRRDGLARANRNSGATLQRLSG